VADKNRRFTSSNLKYKEAFGCIDAFRQRGIDFVLYFALTNMTITFRTKSMKVKSILVDALRIIAWQEYKVTNKEALRDIEYGGYAVFAEEWEQEEILKFDYQELVNFVTGLEYNVAELLAFRADYYAKKNQSMKNSKSKNEKSAYYDEDTSF